MASSLQAVGFMVGDGGPVVYLAAGRGGERRALVRLLREARGWDLLMTWGGEIVQFISSRALHHELDIIPLHEVMHFDLRRYVAERLGLSGKELAEVAEFLHASGGRNSRMDVRRRCLTDLKLLHGVFTRLKPLLRWTNPELAL